MGCYVELSLDIKLKADTPKEVIDVLKYALSRKASRPRKVKLPDHRFFKNPDWCSTLGCNNDSEIPRLRKLRGKNKGYSLNIYSEFKEYWASEYRFIDWIEPYLDHLPGEILGWREDDYNERTTIKKK